MPGRLVAEGAGFAAGAGALAARRRQLADELRADVLRRRAGARVRVPCPTGTAIGQ